MRTFKKIIDLLTPQETKRLFFILIMGLIMSLLEVFGVASILPFIAVISKPEIIETNAILLTAYKFSQNFGVNTINKFLLVLALFSFLILVFSLIFKSLTVYAQLRFSARRECSLSQRLLEGYVHQPYAWFLNRNSAELGKNIISEVSLYTNYCLFPMVSLISNFIVVIALITLVIFINPTVAFFTFVILTSAYFIIYKSVSFFLKKIANKNIKSNDKRFSALHELFGAIKELKVRGLEKNYMNRYILSSQLYADTLALSQIISQLPRFFLEIIAYGGMIVIVLVLLKNNNEITSVLPVITAYVFAGYKLIPALQGIYQACVNINFGNPRLKLLHKDIMSLNLEKSINNKLNPISLKQNIELKNIYFTYPNITKPTLDNISINISSKSIVGLVGTTGSGKTTLADIILGLLEPQQGKLMIDGKCLDYNSWKFWQKKIGYVPQNIYLCDDTVLANIAIGIEPANGRQFSFTYLFASLFTSLVIF